MASNFNHKTGFTFVELSLSIGFVSTLLIMLTFIIFQMTTIYQKTLSIQAVNDAGRELIDQFSRSISASTVISTYTRCSGVDDANKENCINDGAFKLIYRQYESDKFKIRGDFPSKPVPTTGNFCTGLYSYIWNTGYVLDPANPDADIYRAKVKYTDSSGASVESSDFRLLRVYDPLGRVCENNLNDNTYTYSTNNTNITYELPAGGAPSELLASAESNLALYDLKIFHPARHDYSGQAFYSGTFILATIQGNVDIMANGNYCKEPASNNFGEFTYCAINKFNFASQATGETTDV